MLQSYTCIPTVVTAGGCNDGVVLLSREDGKRRDDCSPGKCGCNVRHRRLAALRDRLSPGTGHPSRMDPIQVKSLYAVHKVYSYKNLTYYIQQGNKISRAL